MKITKIETICLDLKDVGWSAKKGVSSSDSTQDAVVVKVHTDEGIVGIGEIDSLPSIAKAVVEASVSHRDSHGVAELLLGEDPFDIEKLWRKVYLKTAHYGRRGIAIQVMGGIDIALWDIIGKACGRPVHKLLGGCFRDKVQAYASTWMPGDLKEAVERIVGFVEKGYKGVKFGFGAFGEQPGKHVQLVKAARQALGEDIKLMVDAAQKWHVFKAIDMARRLEEYNLFFLEDPISPDDFDGYARLTRSTFLRIAAGEAYTTRFPHRDLIEKGGVDVVQPDVPRVGGISEAMKIARMAQDRGVMCVPHCYSTDISLAATLHVLAAMPEESLLEFPTPHDTTLKEGVVLEPFRVDKEGFVEVPKKPGLGIELNEETVKKYSKC